MEGFKEVLLLGQNVNSYADPSTTRGPAHERSSPYYARVGDVIVLQPPGSFSCHTCVGHTLLEARRESNAGPVSCAGLQLCI